MHVHQLSEELGILVKFLPCSSSQNSEMADIGSVVRRLYLSVYNWAVFFGWAQVLYYLTLALLESGHEAIYAAVERPLQFAQTAAFMEILHSATGKKSYSS
ncbi:hypothetical protein GUJ93_ZPchr0001g29828 [Zizania palustris]|uniref:very-long-chain (3R)-3-hydroxyacyl-CoA dehydratase n=1 Tax=Zizania palustris TaxID=103762 RepID=A0A8J5RNQ7_ZIZPA|nr:hypothetical protein GUJ93_ZPchr0001g29828 [Zizania palustris]